MNTAPKLHAPGFCKLALLLILARGIQQETQIFNLTSNQHSGPRGRHMTPISGFLVWNSCKEFFSEYPCKKLANHDLWCRRQPGLSTLGFLEFIDGAIVAKFGYHHENPRIFVSLEVQTPKLQLLQFLRKGQKTAKNVLQRKARLFFQGFVDNFKNSKKC